MTYCRPQILRRPNADGPTRYRGFIATLLGAILLFAGCKSADYRGATLPAEMRAPPVNRMNHMDVAGMVGPGTNTNQINPGDLVEITVVSGRNDETEKKPFQVRVASDGTVDAPPIGPVPVAGMEPIAAEQQIAQQAIARGVFVRPNVTVQVLKPAVNRITVLGAVMEPGVKEIPKGSSDLARALAMAGGMAEDASTKVDVLRYSSQSFVADANTASPGEVVQASFTSNGVPMNGNMTPPQTTRIDLAQVPQMNTPSYSLGDRDVVMVLPQDKQYIHVTGLVHQPNQFELSRHQDVTVLDAIAMAGGISSPVADKVFVIRQLPNMPKPAVIEVSIADAKRDGNENVRLAPGDLVSVERTVSTVMVDTVMTVFRVGVSVGGNLVAF